MEMNGLFSALSLFSVFIYIYIGLYTFKQNKESIVHRFFLMLCTSYAIWSFAYAFAYLANDKYVFSLWNKISAIGWCSFSAISLYLVLLITENKIIKKRIVKILIFFPAILFLYMSVFLFGEGIQTSPLITNIFYTGDFLYNFIFLLISIIVLFVWGLKSGSRRIKKQSNILVLSSLFPFCLNLLTQTIMPLFGIDQFPHMGQLYSVIMIIGTYIVITKYKFLRLPEKFIYEEITPKLMDMVIFVNGKYEIIRISKRTLELLNFEEHELIGKSVINLFDEDNKRKIDIGNINKMEEQNRDMEILGKYGQKIPVNINYLPIFDEKIHDFLGAVLVMQDISIEYELRKKNEELHEKTIRDSLTNLYNHQYSIEIIKNEIDRLDKYEENKQLSLMMIDIDHFKKVNDTYGHIFGDYVLETLSSVLVKNTNDSGHVARFGGEEFIIILPQIEIEKACDIGEKIRKGIEEYKFHNDLKLTVSIGIKQFRNESSIELVKCADDLLYKAKQNGRNRIEYS